jgi:hypothetical protein
VTDQFYFATLAGIALSAAGFAGLVTALRGEGQWTRTELWRLRNIVRSSLMIVLVSLLPVPIYRGVAGDEMLVIRIMSALLVLIFAFELRRTFADSKEWPGYGREAGLIVGAQLLVQLINVYMASLALLMLGLVAWLTFPLQLFMRVIRDFRPPTRED